MLIGALCGKTHFKMFTSIKKSANDVEIILVKTVESVFTLGRKAGWWDYLLSKTK